MIGGSIEPTPEDAVVLVAGAATYDDPTVIDAMLFAYRIGVIRGRAQGERFGLDAIASLREGGAFE